MAGGRTKKPVTVGKPFRAMQQNILAAEMELLRAHIPDHMHKFVKSMLDEMERLRWRTSITLRKEAAKVRRSLKDKEKRALKKKQDHLNKTRRDATKKPKATREAAAKAAIDKLKAEEVD